MTLSLRMLESQLQEASRLLFRDENEAALLALCGRSRVPNPWSGGVDERFLVRQLIEVPPEAYEARTPTDLTWSTTPFYNALKQAEDKNLAVAVIHSHPAGHAAFSPRDDIAERELFEIAFNRLESPRPHLSIIMERSGAIVARAYGPDLKPQPVDRIITIGDRWRLMASAAAVQDTPELDRQIRAFGALSLRTLSQLRIGIVGCGGTGSAVASLLARIGVRWLALIDADRVEDTNLNRLQFSKRRDATLRRLKIDVVAEGIADIGLPMSIVRVPQLVDHPDALSVLRSCDVIFGCTDDHLGREILNRLAHFYYIPVIDTGLLIEPADAGGYDTFDGRVTVVQPGYVCQGCRGLIDSEQMHLDALRRDPDIFEERRRAGYIPDSPDPSPVVVTFTTEVATMAVNELFHRLNGFRGDVENCSERVRHFPYLKDSDLTPGGKSKPGCPLCDRRKYDGRGDMGLLLDMAL